MPESAIWGLGDMANTYGRFGPVLLGASLPGNPVLTADLAVRPNLERFNLQ